MADEPQLNSSATGLTVGRLGYSARMNPDGALTLGVEEEFLLVDAEGQLATVGPQMSAELGQTPDGQVEHELRRCQVESATGVCHSVSELLEDLRRLRTRLIDRAAQRGVRLLPSGTTVLAWGSEPGFTRDHRYQRMAAEFGELADQSLTCACHVHVAIPDRESGMVASNALRPWLPVLLALSANSPFHAGTDTGYASWRHLLWTRWPSAGAPPHFDSTDDYESRVDGLLRSGAIVDRGMIYWDVRLSEHAPTVEVRIADVAPDVQGAALLAVLVRALVGQALDTMDTSLGKGLTQEVLRARLWRSARDGLAGACVDPRSGELVPAWQVVDSLVSRLGPQLRATGDDAFVAEAIDRLRATGGGAQRQRAAFARDRRLTDVVDELSCRS